MFRALRAIVLAILVAASLVASGSVASADTGRPHRLPQPAQVVDVTWE